MDEEVAISIRIDAPGTTAEIDKLSSSTESLVEQNKKLVASNQALSKEGKQTSDAFKNNALQLEVNKQKIDQNNTARKSLVKTLADERTNTQKSGDALNKLSPALGGATSGFISLGKAMLALALNPVGLVITAVAVALGTIYTFLTRTAGGADMLDDAFTAVTTTIDVLLDRVARLGGGLVSLFKGLFTGDFDAIKEGITGITTAFDGMGKEIAEEVSQANELNEAIRNLEDAEIDLEIASAKTENTVKRLLLQARNRTISEQERLKILEQASSEEEALNQKRLKNANQAVQNAADEAKKRLNIRQQENETAIAYGERLIEAFKGQGAAQADNLRDDLKNALIAYQQVVGQSLALQEKISNQRDAAQAKLEEQQLKQIENEQKLFEASAKKDLALQAEIERLSQLTLGEQLYNEVKRQSLDLDNEELIIQGQKIEKAITAEEQVAAIFNAEQLRKEADVESTEEQVKANQELESARKKDVAAQKQQVAAAKEIAATGAILTAAFGKQTLAYKAGAIAQATANTWLGVTQILSEKSALPFPFSVIAKTAAVVGTIASGVNAVRNIISSGNGISAAAGGGDFMTKGPTLLLVGDNPGGVEHVSVKPVSGTGKTVVRGNLVKAAGGVEFTSVGSLTTGSARIAESGLNMRQLASLVNSVKIVLPIDSVQEKIATDDEIKGRAQVV